MINKKKRVMQVFLVNVILIMILCPLISALAFSSYYQTAQPVRVAPGEERDVVIGNLQNSGEKDITVKITLLEDAGIATLIDDEIIVPAGATNGAVTLRISIPEDISEGTPYSLKMNLKELSLEEDAMVAVSNSQTLSIPVLAEEQPLPVSDATAEKVSSGASTIWYWIIAIIILIAIVAWILVRRKSSE